jgi:endonuclease III
MRRAAIANKIRALLNTLIPAPKVPLLHTDPFTLLVAVLLSAQCTDERVNAITPRLFALAPTPEQMAQLSIEAIEEVIRPCGLSKRKAEAIKKLSVKIFVRFKGQVPATFHDLESLPGVGHKTASVVLVQAFGVAAFPVDRHIFRCARRWHLSDGKTVQAVERDLKKLFPKKSWGKIHLQILLYARKFCPARQHIVTLCPICNAIHTNFQKS